MSVVDSHVQRILSLQLKQLQCQYKSAIDLSYADLARGYKENYSRPVYTGRPGSSEVPRNPLTRWDVSSIPANGIFLTKKIKNKNKYE